MDYAIAIAAGLAVYAVWRDRMPRLRMWLLFLLGLVVVGLLGKFNGRLAEWMTISSDAASHKILGISAGIVAVAVIVACEFWDRASPRGGSGGGRWTHSIMAFVAPEIFIAAGGIFAAAAGIGTWLLSSAPDVINSGTQALSGLF